MTIIWKQNSTRIRQVSAGHPVCMYLIYLINIYICVCTRPPTCRTNFFDYRDACPLRMIFYTGTGGGPTAATEHRDLGKEACRYKRNNMWARRAEKVFRTISENVYVIWSLDNIAWNYARSSKTDYTTCDTRSDDEITGSARIDRRVPETRLF